MKKLNLSKIGWVATAAIIAVSAILSYLDSQGVPTGNGEGLLFSRPTTVVTPATPKPPRSTPTGIVTTQTPTPSPTLPTTATPDLPTATPGGTATPALSTATPVAGDPCSHWHPYGPDLRYPSLGAFDMGVNPCTLIPVFGETLNTYLTEENVDGFPKSGEFEEVDGYTWLYARVKEDGTQDQLIAPGAGCALFDNGSNPIDDKLCITNVAYRVHMRGDEAHAKKRNHSGIIFARACAIGANGKPELPCGVVMTSGIEDWGPKHVPYKTSYCYDATTPRHFETNELYPLDLIGQTPYFAIQPTRGGYSHQFVSTITFNPNVEPYYMGAYPEFPNHILRATWNLMDALEEFHCAEGEEIKPTGFLATKYILHAVTLANLPETRPFVGWTDKNGYVDPTCTETGWTCYPLVITEDLPLGTPFMSYMVQMDGLNADGTSTGVIIQDYGP